jgi:tetratricopeptide (TPR) repeat protein
LLQPVFCGQKEFVMEDMDRKTRNAIAALLDAGDYLAANENYDEAIAKYGEAWRLLPEPQTDFPIAATVLAGIGDACFLSEDFDGAYDAFAFSMHCPDAIGNPFLHLRLGQILFERHELDRAADELIRAFMGAGDEIFESEDPKYRQFLATRAEID